MQTAESRQFFVYKLPLIKGICILGVILIHVTNYSTMMTHFGSLSSVVIFAGSLARFAVPLFIMLSGFYLSLNPHNEVAGPFYRRTLKLLLIPYAIYSLMYSLPELVKSGKLWVPVSNLLTFDAQSHLWFIALIIQFYLLHPFLIRFYHARKRHGALVFFTFLLQIVYSSLITALVPHASEATFLTRFLTTLFFPSYIAYFLSGYYLLEHSEAVIRVLQRRIPAIVGCVVWMITAVGISAALIASQSQGIIYQAIQNELVRLAGNLLTPLMTFSALIAIVALIQRLKRKKNAVRGLLNSLGLYCYGVFYLHIFYLRLGVRGLHLAHIGPDEALFYLLLFPLTAVLTLVSVRWLARLPFGWLFT